MLSNSDGRFQNVVSASQLIEGLGTEASEYRASFGLHEPGDIYLCRRNEAKGLINFILG